MGKGFDLSKTELEKLYQFHSCQQIGVMHGVNAETVRKKLHKHGISIGKVGGRRAFDPPKDVLETMYQSMSMRDIAAQFGCGETVVFKRLKEHGIELEHHKNHRLKPGRVFSDEHVSNIRKSLIARAAYGEKNPNWKGGLSEINRIARTNWEAREWRKLSLERTNHQCEKCGVEQDKICECCGIKIRLHVHHVKSFAKYPELRYDPNNSEVLCPKCHHQEHQQTIIRSE